LNPLTKRKPPFKKENLLKIKYIKMEKNYIKSGYHITTDTKFQSKRYEVSPELENQLEQLFIESQEKNNKKIIEKLTQLIIQYPKVPILKNYLSTAYSVQGKYEKAIDVNNWILAEHPDYLFAILNQANLFIENLEFNKVPEILGESIEIKALYPDRDLFHFAEVTGFLKVAIRYFSAIGNLELAENRLEILREIAPEHPDTGEAEAYLIVIRFKKAAERFLEESKQKISTTPIKTLPKFNKTAAPKFNHPEIQNLYNFGFDIPSEKLKQIIALPRATVIEDLERILEDAVERYDYFSNLEWQKEIHNFALHAIFLLEEINATESLPKILSFLKNDSEFNDLWLGDFLTESLWNCIYRLGFNNTSILKEFLLQPGIDTYCKTAVTEALSQMVLHHSEKRAEILSVFTEVFTVFSEATLEDNLIDSDFLGLSIGDAMQCKLHELLPIIKVLYEKAYVSNGICGKYEVVEKEFFTPVKKYNKRNVLNIFELYDDVLNSWYAYREKEDPIDYFIPPPAVSNKIGRNEPCPCGSGKKYKKCCLNN
jgi:tetratricopeptide (TPR) repeat protein